MKNVTRATVFAFFFTVLPTTPLPTFASTANLRIIGTVTPPTCTPLLGGGGTLEYGTIHPSSLSPTDYTTLPELSLAFNITCTGPAKVAIILKNGRKGSLAGVPEGTTGAGPSPVPLAGLTNVAAVGLGLHEGKPIGGYAVVLPPTSVLADGSTVHGISRNAHASIFEKDLSGNMYSSSADRLTSWAAADTLEPLAFTALTSTIKVQAYLNNSAELGLEKSITLDGLTTIELIYL